MAPGRDDGDEVGAEVGEEVGSANDIAGATASSDGDAGPGRLPTAFRPAPTASLTLDATLPIAPAAWAAPLLTAPTPVEMAPGRFPSAAASAPGKPGDVAATAGAAC